MKEKGSGESTPGTCQGLICWDFTATATGRPINQGVFKARLRVPDGAAFTNNQGRSCRPADGTGTFRKGQHKIMVAFEGTACSVSKKTAATKMRAYARITGGEGDFKNATGAGGLTINFHYTKGPNPVRTRGTAPLRAASKTDSRTGKSTRAGLTK